MSVDNAHFYGAMGVASCIYATAIFFYAKKVRAPVYEKIRLPLAQEDGAIVHHTLKGEWLVGWGTYAKGLPSLGSYASSDERKQWGPGAWFVIRSASKKLVVYRKGILPEDPEPTVQVFDSFEDMQPRVPPSIYNEAAQKAGLTSPPQLPEVPLEGV